MTWPRQSRPGARGPDGKSNGNYLISVRAPMTNKRGAAELCIQFPTGGGRAAAAGINDLPADQLPAFVDAFEQAYPG